MKDFFEIDETNKTIRILNLDNLSIEDLRKYISELKQEVDRVQIEIKKKESFKRNAEEFFK
tara:strand:- start:1784 stop:1966 length:183 start_codon:yes stop_codon:yes gene_type:complete